MATFAFDFAGLLNDNIYALMAMMHAVKYSGHRVIVLADDVEGRRNTDRAMRVRLIKLGIVGEVHYDEIILCTAESILSAAHVKGVFCASRRVDVMFGVDDALAEIVKSHSPKTTVYNLVTS